jgi:site-specific DNA recombinase
MPTATNDCRHNAAPGRGRTRVRHPCSDSTCGRGCSQIIADQGSTSSALSFGYRIVRRFENGVVSTGEREIVPEEADIIRRIFKQYLAGAPPRQLNRDGLHGPRGALWSPSTIHGNPRRGLGILHKELYIGRMVWNRQRFLKDPDTGKRVTRLNPESEWVISDVPAP